ncbi:MAG: hypothetical protein ACK4M7_08830, partial [Burkholderiales bacterium]
MIVEQLQKPVDALSESEASEESKALSKAIHHYNYCYYVLDAPEVSDAEYDALMQRLQAIEVRFPALRSIESPTQVIGGVVAEGFKKVTHRKPMLSLANAHSIEDITDFMVRIRKYLHLLPEQSFQLV